mmetsp:Transcript_34891/g.81588  ORF Transcript_34891/g.81588 Transcript_34891/m.81588 type:complete len:1185 (+) Transcript_34891:75-3629(+)
MPPCIEGAWRQSPQASPCAGDVVLPEEFYDLKALVELEKQEREAEVATLRAEIAELRVFFSKLSPRNKLPIDNGASYTAEFQKVLPPVYRSGESKELKEGLAAQGTQSFGLPREPSTSRSLATKEFVEDYHYRKLAESVWDAALLLGVCMPIHQTLFGCILFAANMGLQLLFAVVVSAIADNSHEEIDQRGLQGLLLWRLGVGHDVSNYDEFTGSSLVSRVCGTYLGLTTSSLHFTSLDSFDEYLDVLEFQGMSLFGGVQVGKCLAIMVLAVWLSLVAVECIDIIKFATSVMCLPHSGSQTKLVKVTERTLQITMLSRPRVCMMWLLVIIPRTFVAFVLAASGCNFLIRSYSLNDLLFNAITLGFVFDLDEAFFRLLPARCQNMTTQLDRMPMRRKKEGHRYGARRILRDGHGFREMGVMLFFVGVLIWYANTTLKDVWASIEEGRDILCSGNRDFVYATDEVTLMVYYINGTTHSDDLEFHHLLLHGPSSMLTLQMSASLQLTGLSRSLSTVESILSNTVAFGEDRLSQPSALWYLQDLQRRTLEESIAGLECRDKDGNAPERHALYERIELSIPQLLEGGDRFSDRTAVCADVADMCDNLWARVYCSSVCRCTDLYYGVIDLNGCPDQCRSSISATIVEFQLETSLLNSERCVDASRGSNPHAEQVDLQWVDRFISHTGMILESRNLILQNGTLWQATEALANDISARTNGAYRVADEAYEGINMLESPLAFDYPCLLQTYLDLVFSTTLCDWETSFRNGYGSLVLLCPRQCKLCNSADFNTLDDTDTSQDMNPLEPWHDLFRVQTYYFGGKIVERNPPVVQPLACGSDTFFETITLPDHALLPGGDALFGFQAEADMHYTVDLCGSTIDTVLRLYAGNWSETLHLNNPIAISDDACGTASSLSLANLHPGSYTVWIDSPSTGSGIIAMSFRCSTRPLFWEVMEGSCTVTSDEVCVDSPHYPASYINKATGRCFVRAFPNSWEVYDKVLGAKYFQTRAADALLFGGAIVSQSHIFTAQGSRPDEAPAMEWLPDASPDSDTNVSLGWRICAQNRSRQPWEWIEGPCSRAYIQMSEGSGQDCVFSPNYPENYGNLELCRFDVALPWEETHYSMEQVHLDTHSSRDWLELDGHVFHGVLAASQRDAIMLMKLNSSIGWKSDIAGTASGFSLCTNSSGSSTASDVR